MCLVFSKVKYLIILYVNYFTFWFKKFSVSIFILSSHFFHLLHSEERTEINQLCKPKKTMEIILCLRGPELYTPLGKARELVLHSRFPGFILKSFGEHWITNRDSAAQQLERMCLHSPMLLCLSKGSCVAKPLEETSSYSSEDLKCLSDCTQICHYLCPDTLRKTAHEAIAGTEDEKVGWK